MESNSSEKQRLLLPDTNSLSVDPVSPKPPILIYPSQQATMNNIGFVNSNTNNLIAPPVTTNYASSSAPQPNEKVTRTRMFSGSQNTRPLKVTSLTDFLRIELTRGYRVELEEERFTARREKVYTFISIPKELERFMSYGFFQCVDAFLYLFTFLPIRCLLALISFGQCTISQFTNFSKSMKLQSNEKCDLLKLLILTFCVYIFSFIDTSVMYHVIKSQSVIKLYIFFNMLEVGDRLFASFVQDTLDALFLTAVEKVPEDSKYHHRLSLILHLALTIFSVACHAVVLLLQGTTLNVAINSSNRALLTVMMSNNFVELKGAVFKKFDKLNLFQVSCSDVRERFHLCVLLFVVCIQTMREYQWEESRFWILLPDCIMVLIAEIFVDWLKHAFVTRFNEISPEVYREYTLSLAFDLAQTKNRRAFSDSSDMVGRRLGFVPLPLAVVLFKVMRPSLKSLDIGNCILILLMYFAITSFRLMNSVLLLGKACTLIDQYQGKTAASKEVTKEEEEIDRHQHHDALSRAYRSHPTTRTPSPSRGPSSADSESPVGTPVKQMAGAGGSFSASQSVSTSPRASIVGGTINSADTSQLLFANSAVSILSMNLNEELFKSKDTKVKDSPSEKIKNKNKHRRKYSLGNEFKFETVEELDSTLIPSAATTPTPPQPDDDDDEANDEELEKILGGEFDKENYVGEDGAVLREPVRNRRAAAAASATGNESADQEKLISQEEECDEDGSISSPSSKTVKKRKGLSWLLHH